MKIKGYDGHEHNVTSQGQGTYNTVAGSLGIASFLGLNANNVFGGNGCGGGIFNRGGGNGDCYISEKEFNWAQAYNTKQSEVDMLKSDQRTDGKLLDLYREIDRRFTVTGTEIATIAATQAVTNEKLNGTIALLDTKIDGSIAALNCKMSSDVASLYKDIQIEAEKRCCGDNSIVSYVNQTFYPKYVADLTTKTTTTPENVYNPLPNCCPCQH